MLHVEGSNTSPFGRVGDAVQESKLEASERMFRSSKRLLNT